MTEAVDYMAPREDEGGSSFNNEGADYVPRPKRIACVLCRRRKLKCDGSKPSCGTCSRLSHDCTYDEIRKKSGPKRGYVKQLEARLAQVETLLKTQDTDPEEPSFPDFSKNPNPLPTYHQPEVPEPIIPDLPTDASMLDPQLDFGADPMFDMGTTDFSWEMISLGVEEPLPQPEVMDELTDIYFKTAHFSVPVLHRPRYYASLNSSPHMKPPICLRYAIWTHAASHSPKYKSAETYFYERARKYAQADEMKAFGEQTVSLAHAQFWTIIAAYEFKMMMFPRAWLSVGRASRLCQMMGLHRLDGKGLDVKLTVPPPRDWTELEERRRTFWASFCHDRYASIGTGWPMTYDEKDISTLLPASDESYSMSKSELTPSLEDALHSRGEGKLSAWGGVCVLACLFGRNLHHLHRPDPEDHDYDINGPFWTRHRELDNLLLGTSLSLPSSIRLPQGLSNPNAIYCNMNIHTATICLHQAAIFKADQRGLQPNISVESKRRCIVAAEQITNIMKMISTMNLGALNPFTSFSVYVAARVFVQYLKSVPDDESAKSSLSFLLSAMRALKTDTPLTESFIAQLDVDLEGSGLDSFRAATKVDMNQPALAQAQINDSVKCIPLIDIREEQSQFQFKGNRGVFASPKSTTETVFRMKGPTMQTALNSLPGQVHFPGQSSGTAFVAQDISVSPGPAFLSEHSLSNSDHPTPSTSSQKDSSNTSTYSPGDLGANIGPAGVAPCNPGHLVFSTDGLDASATAYTQSGESSKQRVDLQGFDGSTWEMNLNGMSTGFTPRGNGDEWTPQVTSDDWAQSIEPIQTLEAMGWNGWNQSGGGTQ